MARYVLDIFLSSTSEDLREDRDTVVEGLGGLGQFTVRMESFGAKPTKPLTACRKEVEGCDALIVLVGHRYGWIPGTEDGGDGEKSITWWEVTWALDAGKPVYAFLVDLKAPWTGPREQDALVAAANEAESLTTWRAVKRLQAFRAFLEKQTTRVLFRNADQLGRLVVGSLFQWLLQHAAPVRTGDPGDDAPARIVTAGPAGAGRGRQSAAGTELLARTDPRRQRPRVDHHASSRQGRAHLRSSAPGPSGVARHSHYDRRGRSGNVARGGRRPHDNACRADRRDGCGWFYRRRTRRRTARAERP